jgi:hypothetical protein
LENLQLFRKKQRYGWGQKSEFAVEHPPKETENLEDFV